MDELEKVTNKISAPIAETIETRSRSSPAPYQTPIMPSYPTLIKPTESSVSPTALAPTNSITLSLPEPEGAESRILCSKEEQSKNTTRELRSTESALSFGSFKENCCLVTTTVGSINSIASEQELSASTAALSAAVLLPPKGFYTSSFNPFKESSRNFAIAGSIVAEHTMSVFINEGTYSNHVPSASLQSNYDLSTLTYSKSKLQFFILM